MTLADDNLMSGPSQSSLQLHPCPVFASLSDARIALFSWDGRGANFIDMFQHKMQISQPAKRCALRCCRCTATGTEREGGKEGVGKVGQVGGGGGGGGCRRVIWCKAGLLGTEGEMVHLVVCRFIGVFAFEALK